MKIFTTKFARSIFYILFIGGLFVSQALMLTFLWKLLGIDAIFLYSLNILESGGIIALAYVFVFGIRFGTKQELDKTSVEIATNSRFSDNMSGVKAIDVVKNLSNQEKSALKKKLMIICNGNKKSSDFPEGSQARI